MASSSLPEHLRLLLDSADVHMKNREQTLEKIARVIAGGADQLSVIADFDHTLSIAVEETTGTLAPVTHQVFGDALVLPDLNKQENKEAYAKFSSGAANTDRMAMFEKWWARAHEGVAAAGLTRKQIIDRADALDFRLREHTVEMLRALAEKQIPTIVMTGGIADVASLVLLREAGEAAIAHCEIVGNRLIFDHQGALTGFSTPLLHAFNKSGAAIDKSSPSLARLLTRPHLLLLGDSLGDVAMEKGLYRQRDDSLRIGFLNGHEDKLDHFSAAFDLVLLSAHADAGLVKSIVDALSAH